MIERKAKQEKIYEYAYLDFQLNTSLQKHFNKYTDKNVPIFYYFVLQQVGLL